MWKPIFKPLVQSLSGLVLEAPCPLCQRKAAPVFCVDCTRQIDQCRLKAVVRAKLARSPDSTQPPFRDQSLFAWGTYGGALKRSLTTLKYNNQPQIAQPLGQWLAEAWLDSPQARRNLLVVPIPLHASKQQSRGFNQAELLAESFCQSTGLPLSRTGLLRSRQTQAQFQLSMAEREANLSEAFEVGRSLLQQTRHRAVLLLDDIYTTGATVRAATRALEHLKIPVYGAVAVAIAVQAGSLNQT